MTMPFYIGIDWPVCPKLLKPDLLALQIFRIYRDIRFSNDQTPYKVSNTICCITPNCLERINSNGLWRYTFLQLGNSHLVLLYNPPNSIFFS